MSKFEFVKGLIIGIRVDRILFLNCDFFFVFINKKRRDGVVVLGVDEEVNF